MGADAGFLRFDDRPSDSPYVERVWQCRSERAGTFLSVAASHCELVLTRLRGRTIVTLRGPETGPSQLACPADGEWIGIRLAIGAFLPLHPAGTLLDRRDVNLPGGTSRTFWLDGAAWEHPTFDNAEALVARLVRAGILARDSAVPAALAGDLEVLGRRSVQRHFLMATGMSHRLYRQIQRARRAAVALRSGASIADVVHQTGYFDQAHLTRSLHRLMGTTPARIRRHERQLSFLYKTDAPARG